MPANNAPLTYSGKVDFSVITYISLQQPATTANRKVLNKTNLLWFTSCFLYLGLLNLQTFYVTFPTRRIEEVLETEDIVKVVERNRLQWYGYVLGKDIYDGQVKMYSITLDAEEARQRGKPRKICTDYGQGNERFALITK